MCAYYNKKCLRKCTLIYLISETYLILQQVLCDVILCFLVIDKYSKNKL